MCMLKCFLNTKHALTVMINSMKALYLMDFVCCVIQILEFFSRKQFV